jgi:hypothetical protein
MIRSPFLTWLKRQAQVSNRRPARIVRDAKRGKLYLEVLEDRTLLNATVLDVTTTNPSNSILGSGATVTVQVDFNEKVDVTGTPTIQLNDSKNSVASYSSGSGSTALLFTLTVPAGDTTSGAALDYTSTTALGLNAGTINDDPTTGDSLAATLTLPTPATPNDSLHNANLVIDATTPTVTSVTSTTAAGTYGPGATVTLDVAFSENVTVSGTPTLTLSDGKTASYTSGSGSNTLAFTYTVGAGDTTTGNALDVSAINAGPFTIYNAYGTDANLTINGDNVPSNNIIIDATTPTVTGVTSTTSAGTYGTGNVTLDVTFSENVTVTGTPTLTLSDGKTATYASGSGSNTLVFTYAIGAGDTTNTAALDVSSINLSGGTIKNAGGVAATLTLNGDVVPSDNIVIDATTPTVTAVSSTTSPGTYGSGNVTLDVTFSENVTVTGTPTLTLSDGKTATYTSGSGSTTLVFTYAIGAGDTTGGSALDVTALNLSGGTIKNAGGVAATLTIAGDVVPSKNIVIDATTPTVTAVSSTTSAGTYGSGTVTLTVAFSEAVTVTGTPTLTLSDGKTASYSSGTGTNTLTFIYTIGAGDTTSGSALDVTALSLSGGTIKSAAGTAATLTLSGDVVPSKNIVIDATIPTVISLTATAGTYGPGATVNISVNFSEKVTVTGTPTLTLSDGKTAIYSSGSGTNTLVFTYTVANSDSTSGAALDESSSTALSGTIKNAGGVGAALDLPTPGTAGSLSKSNVIIDGTTPSVVNVDSTSHSVTLGAGSTVNITVLFSEKVTVTGTPTLTLSDGRTATYASGSGTSTLTFSYTVQDGDSTNGQALDYASTTALNLNGGSIKSAGGTSAALTLPAPNGVDDLLVTEGIVINAPSPTSTPTTPTPVPNIPAQIQQLVQDVLLMQQELMSGNFSAFVQTAHDTESLFVTVEMELFQILHDNLMNLLSQPLQAIENAHLTL